MENEALFSGFTQQTIDFLWNLRLDRKSTRLNSSH